MDGALVREWQSEQRATGADGGGRRGLDGGWGGLSFY